MKYILLFCSIFTLSAQNIKFKNSEFSGPVFTFKKNHNNLFIGAGSALECFNISNQFNYEFVAKSHSNDVITGITIVDNYIYANNNGIGVTIFKINENNTLSFKKVIFDTIISGHSPAVVLNENAIIFGLGSYGLIVADITDKENPQVIQKIKLPDFLLSLQKYNNMIFASDRSYGIFIFNVTDNLLTPVDTFKINEINYWYYCYVDSNKDKLYVYGHKNLLPVSDTVSIVQYSLNPLNLQQYQSIFRFYARPCVSLTTTENIVYASCWENGTYAIDFSNSNNVQIKYNIPTNNYSIWVDKLNDTIIGIANLSSGLRLYIVNQTTYYELFTIDNFYSDIRGVAIKNNYVYTALLNKGIGIARVLSDSLVKDTIIPVNNIKNIYVSGNYLFSSCDNEGIKIFSLQNSLIPSYVTTIVKPNNNGALSTIRYNNYLMAIDCYYSLLSRPVVLSIWDLSNVNSPVLISQTQITVQNFPYDRPQIFCDLFYPYLSISCFNDALAGSIHIIDISNIQQPQIIYSIQNIYSGQIKFYPTNDELYLLVAVGSSTCGIQNGFKIFKFENSELTELSFFNTGSNGNRTIGLDYYNNYVFIAQGGLSAYGKIIAVDVSNVNNPEYVGECVIGSNTNHSELMLYDNYILHSAGSPGLMLLKFEFQNQISPIFYQLQDTFNSTCNIFTNLNISENITLYDVSGRVLSGNINSYKFQNVLSNLTFGFYLVNKGDKIYKFIKTVY